MSINVLPSSQMRVNCRRQLKTGRYKWFFVVRSYSTEYNAADNCKIVFVTLFTVHCLISVQQLDATREDKRAELAGQVKG